MLTYYELGLVGLVNFALVLLFWRLCAVSRICVLKFSVGSLMFFILTSFNYRYVFGVTHIPRLEDWPVMPVERIGFMLMVFLLFLFLLVNRFHLQ